jgi:DNA-binding Xre family transcriptional regulator
MSHFQRPKIKDLAKSLGIDRRSLARLLASGKVPGFERGPTGRWRLVDFGAFEAWAKEYREAGEAKHHRAMKSQTGRVLELERGARFSRRYGHIKSAESCEREIRFIETAENTVTISMTQKARQLGITPQAVRNRIAAGKINGVRFTGQR